VPHTAGRYQTKRFRKAQCPIVERLTNSLMMHGRNNGKKQLAVRIVRHALEIVHLLSDQNPVQVVVDAIINAGPREDATRIGSAGVVRRQAVDISPLRRVNQAIFLITTGAREAAFRNVKTIAECLADELINAAKGSSNSYAIKKKDEIEVRTAAAPARRACCEQGACSVRFWLPTPADAPAALLPHSAWPRLTGKALRDTGFAAAAAQQRPRRDEAIVMSCDNASRRTPRAVPCHASHIRCV
jgi:small subunit ribosomal protein S5e